MDVGLGTRQGEGLSAERLESSLAIKLEWSLHLPGREWSHDHRTRAHPVGFNLSLRERAVGGIGRKRALQAKVIWAARSGR